MSYWWPIIVVVAGNTMYHICAKSLPAEMDPFASLTATYLIAAAASALIYFISNHGGNLIAEYRHANWTTFALGIVIIALEVGSIFMYRAGWNINTAELVFGTILAIVLIFVGRFLYGEAVTFSKVAGIAVCLAGLYLINR